MLSISQLKHLSLQLIMSDLREVISVTLSGVSPKTSDLALAVRSFTWSWESREQTASLRTRMLSVDTQTFRRDSFNLVHLTFNSATSILRVANPSEWSVVGIAPPSAFPTWVARTWSLLSRSCSIARTYRTSSLISRPLSCLLCCKCRICLFNPSWSVCRIWRLPWWCIRTVFFTWLHAPSRVAKLFLIIVKVLQTSSLKSWLERFCLRGYWLDARILSISLSLSSDLSAWNTSWSCRTWSAHCPIFCQWKGSRNVYFQQLGFPRPLLALDTQWGIRIWLPPDDLLAAEIWLTNSSES